MKDSKLMRLSMIPDAVSDPVLESFGSEAASATVPVRGWPEERPFDLRVMRPRVFDVHRLCAAAGLSRVTPEVSGPHGVPLLIVHGVTAHPATRRPFGIWAIDYEVRIEAPEAVSLSLEPGTTRVDLDEAQTSLSLGVRPDGRLGEAAEATRGLLEIALTGADIRVTRDPALPLAVHVPLKLLKAQAEAVEPSCAKWSLYGRDDPLEGPQVLLQTIAVPAGTTLLRASIRTWIRKLRGADREPVCWDADPVSFELALE